MKKRNKEDIIRSAIESIPYIVVGGTILAGIYLSHHIDIKPQHSISPVVHKTH